MNILLSGATGEMGQVVVNTIKEKENIEIVAGIGRKNIQSFFPIYRSYNDIKEDIDIILDFSHHENLDELLEFSLGYKLPLVIATTGFNDKDINKIRSASEEIPLFFSRNMSIGINLLLNTVEKLSSQLEGFDIEIIEKHHKLKADAPSGTALMLFDAVNKGREGSLKEDFGRSGRSLKREENQVGLHGVRGGTIVGEHEIIFAGLDEVIEIKHSAQSKKIFAEGALKACKFLINKNCGLYSMKDLLDI